MTRPYACSQDAHDASREQCVVLPLVRQTPTQPKAAPLPSQRARARGRLQVPKLYPVPGLVPGPLSSWASLDLGHSRPCPTSLPTLHPRRVRHAPRPHPRKQPTPPSQHIQARHALPRQPSPLGCRHVRGQFAVHLPDRRGREAACEVACESAGPTALPRDHPAEAPLIQIAAVLPSPQPHAQPRHRQLHPAQVGSFARLHSLASVGSPASVGSFAMRGSFAIKSGVEWGVCARPRNVPVSSHARSVTHLRSRRRRLCKSAIKRRSQRLHPWKQFG